MKVPRSVPGETIEVREPPPLSIGSAQYKASRARPPPSRRQAAPSRELVLDPRDPMKSARAFFERQHRSGGLPILHHHRGAFYTWTNGAYSEVDDGTIRARLWRFLELARQPTCLGGTECQHEGGESKSSAGSTNPSEPKPVCS